MSAIVVRASTDQRNDLIKRLRPNLSNFFTRLYNKSTVYWIDVGLPYYEQVKDRNILYLTDEEKQQVPWGIEKVNNYIKAYRDTGKATADLSEETSKILTLLNKWQRN